MADNELTNWKEKLLCKLYDGECNPFERLLALWVSRSGEGKSFFDGLRKTSSDLESLIQTNEIREDLWDKISRRINEEERAAIFLGKRAYDNSTDSKVWSLERIRWGFSGAFVAASIAIIALSFNTKTVNQGKINQLNANLTSNTNEAAQLSSTEYAKANTSEAGVAQVSGRPEIIDEDYPKAVEVDWMRSDGRVSLIPEPDSQRAIIWVKKRYPVMMKQRNGLRGGNQGRSYQLRTGDSNLDVER